jgi:hypothetical protein
MTNDEWRAFVLATPARTAAPHVCLIFDDERPPFSFVIIEGTVTISEDLDDLLAWATRIAARYNG